MNILAIMWFVLIALFIAVYAILDGFDLGAGIWHLFAKEKERTEILSLIGPFWDGNEVWLLAGGGAIFAAFPHVYATVFSGMYLAIMLVIFLLILRAIAIEFRNKSSSKIWQITLDVAFSISSILLSILFGVAVGNGLRGIVLDSQMNHMGGFSALFSPYTILTGILTLTTFAAHGALYISMKVKTELKIRAKRWVGISSSMSIPVYLVFVIATLFTKPHLIENYMNQPLLTFLPFMTILFMLMAKYLCAKEKQSFAFILSAFSIAFIITSMGAALFPSIIPAVNDPALSLTLTNASSSALTLKTMLIIAAIGMPLVIGYHVWSYKLWSAK